MALFNNNNRIIIIIEYSFVSSSLKSGLLFEPTVIPFLYCASDVIVGYLSDYNNNKIIR